MKEKECFICHKIKPIDEFYTHKEMVDGHLNKCKECVKKYMRSRRVECRKLDYKRHHYNPERLLKHRYYAIRFRTTSKAKCGAQRNRKYAERAPDFTLEEWMDWCHNKTWGTFISLYRQWQESGFERRFAPSIDRIDNERGYTLDNLQWLTASGNYRKGTKKMDKKYLERPF